jgi:hypothetical protein
MSEKSSEASAQQRNCFRCGRNSGKIPYRAGKPPSKSPRSFFITIVLREAFSLYIRFLDACLHSFVKEFHGQENICLEASRW